ncbi:MAG: hypothetical protein B6I29_03450 [Marinitoga sp. 4572_148]|nr:MAG: hypothetical protein B6I29_03450 [Marinitoga sp. 4572_148]
MRIENYDIWMMSETIKIQKNYKRVKLKVILPRKNRDLKKNFIRKIANLFESFELEKITDIEENMNIDNKDELKLRILIAMLEKLTGKKIKVYKIKEFQNVEKIKKINPEIYNSSGESEIRGVEYEFAERNVMYEKKSFKANGIIQTDNGKKIKFNILFNVEKSSINERVLKITKLKDPIIINYNGNIPDLSDKTFLFDIDSDGDMDNLPIPGKGNGFLVLDKNQNGKVDNGNELFGPKNENGFSELKKYDLDNNNWIDENDPVFSRLLIWEKTKDGNDRLFSLYDKNIGAIYLGNINVEYNLNNLGIIRKTGIVIKNDHTVGTIHHIDIAI